MMVVRERKERRQQEVAVWLRKEAIIAEHHVSVISNADRSLAGSSSFPFTSTMLVRNLPRFYRHLSHPEIYTYSYLPSRTLHSNARIVDPPANGTGISISLAHPRDPGAPRPSSNANNQNGATTSDVTSGQHSTASVSPTSSIPTPGVPSASTSESDHAPIPDNFAPVVANPPAHPPLPSPGQAPHGGYTNPPFNTHKFFTVLEMSFPTPKARALMRATRALLVDRLGAVKREALTVKDLESVCIIISTYPQCICLIYEI